jgi:hypothetical protein
VSIDPKTAGNIIQILADLPDFLRKSMLQIRLKEFYLMEDPLKYETISIALKAISSMEARKLSVLIKTWLEVLSEFDAEKITTMFRIYCEVILNKNPRIIEYFNIESLVGIFSSLEDRQKEKLIDCLKEVILTSPNKDKLLKSIPGPLLKVLKMK